jgi:hypothetical protein
MNNMTWLDLYKFLYSKANDSSSFGQFDWNSPVIVHDASTGDEYSCDTWNIEDNKGNDKLVLVTNIDSIFSDNKSE